MTLKSGMAVILRYFSEFGSLKGMYRNYSSLSLLQAVSQRNIMKLVLERPWKLGSRFHGLSRWLLHVRRRRE